MRMPSERERRRLEEIEAALRASDPGLDRALRTFRPRRRGLMACLIVGWIAVIVVGLTGWWMVTLLMLGPLLALTCFRLGSRLRAAPPRATGDGMHPPTSSTQWG